MIILLFLGCIKPYEALGIVGVFEVYCRLVKIQLQQSMQRSSSQAVLKPYKNHIYERASAIVCRVKSRFPRLLERLRKRETEWTVWKGTSRAQGRLAGAHNWHTKSSVQVGNLMVRDRND